MISLRQLTLTRAAKILIENASVQIHPGQKVGLTGANGTGKSSLFALLLGELHAEAGNLTMPPDWVIAHVAQETPALDQAALEFALDGDKQLRQVEHDLAAADAAHDGHRVGELHGRLGEIDGYSARARAAELLHGLGFSDTDFAKPVAAFSGGWRVRLNLAQALMSRSDLLLLDEPTNHLDLDAVIWLEGWLKTYPGTLLLISHDRDFLDAVTSHILHIEQRALKLYTGSYSDFERQRAAQLAVQQSMFEKQQRERAHLESFVERFRAKATKARQAQSRIKALARMEDVSAAHVDSPFTFRFRDPLDAPDPLLDVRKVAIGYGAQPILHNVELTIRPGERIGLLGRNGAGKSTLIKLLAGEIQPIAGSRSAGKGLAIGYFAQHQLEQLRPDESPLQHMLRLAPTTREQELRDFLGTFDFRGDAAMAPCGPFSGGEKSRLALALLIWQRPNLLLLDEPTNHLDMEMRHALNLALQEFDGGVVLVSHERSLLRTTCDRFVLVADGAAREFDGDLDDYRDWLNQSRIEQASAEARPEKAERREQRASSQLERQALLAKRRPLAKELEQLDKKLAAWHTEKALLDARAGDATLYEPGQRAVLQDLLKRQGELAQLIETGEERWLALHDLLEQLDQ
ncbi:ribosomal protection-like ABC-F family protein [Sulfuriferula sp.]|uniref:ribosomal protection-like ABC-F family protein n=1 Tax=Sulfuriferula sp. TaxID=2025307 RepID=UPI0027301A87|nr:ATP-binding cassette domain-containing protein [Sulfuriferula sp.]MDP2026894.1 ATP-binding cassette domain-containing protein [Sulfuriferula sp.]